MKRLFDLVLSVALLALVWPIVITALFAVWLYDRHPPIYWARRVGIKNRAFMMAKIRSMRVDADRIGGTSTSEDDCRITPVGHYIRRFKLDELLQLWNVLKGDMHIVGPRPNTPEDVNLYTPLELRLVDVRPGITDISSIVFSDEGAILQGSSNPDEMYNKIIRPWKSRLGLLYIENQSLFIDLWVVLLTVVALFSKKLALLGVKRVLLHLNATEQLITVCSRQGVLTEALPPDLEPESSTRGFGAPINASGR